MLTVNKLRRKPRHFFSFVGLTPEEFDHLLCAVQPVYAEAEQVRLCSRERQRAQGGGGSFRLKLPERLLSTLLYYRLSVTGGLLGYLFGLDESNLSRERNQRMRPVLLQVLPIPMRDHLLSALEEFKEESQEESGQEPSSRPSKPRKRIGTLKELLAAHPEFAEVWLDATEQEVPKPQDKQERKQRYSGKQKCHTLKTQVLTTKNLVLHILGGLPGRLHDHTLLRASGVLHQLPEQTQVRLDRGYEGVEEEYPRACVHKPVRARRNAKLTPFGRAYNQVQSRLRMPVEHLLGRLQKFKVLTGVYRGLAADHEDTFAVVAGLVNFRALGSLQWA
jgi:DDE superfamily endonuclease/Helix-turn-helix of DDE superfamily endonuclease